jgi:hypothetical protein
MLFDLRADPDERTNVADRHPERCERHRATLARFDAHCEETRAVSDAARGLAASRSPRTDG